MIAGKATISSPTSTPVSESLSLQKKQSDENIFFYQAPIQCKLSIGSPDDPLEKEADDMADKVMRMEMPQPINFSSARNTIARKCAHCEEEEKQLQKKESNGESMSVAPPIVHNVLNSSGGRSIDTGTRSFMESRFNYDFSNVKIHDSDVAAKSASSINAFAYTSGNNIVFNSGQYNTNSDSGKRLLAHELTHVVQQQPKSKTIQREILPISSSEVKVARQDNPDAGTSGPYDASLPGGVSTPPEPEPEQTNPTPQQANPMPQNTSQTNQTPQPATCTTSYTTATSFQALIDLVRAAETKLSAAGITSTRDQVHALRGIYYGTTWSADYAVEHSTTRNEGFQRFTRPSISDPNTTTPADVRRILDCGLFTALQSSQDLVDGTRHVDFGHLIIGLDARFDSSFNTNVQYPNPVSSMLPAIDLGGTGPELVTWLGDLGGGAAALAIRRSATPTTNASSVFTGTDYGVSINLEGDVAGFVVASGSGTPAAPQAATFAVGSSRLSDALQNYLSPGSVSPAWRNRATTFLRMYGGVFDASNVLTNSATLISNFRTKIEAFACNYLASRVRDRHLTFPNARTASGYIPFASQEVATVFVNALVDSHTTGNKIEATRFPTPSTGTATACTVQIAAGSLLGNF
jgi:hypothetical protein